jgi:type IV secretion system protein VirB2
MKRMKIRKFMLVLAFMFIALSLALSLTDTALAAGGSGGSGSSSTTMPWEAGLKVLTDSISGPVATAIGLIALVAAGAALIFGGDMTGFMRTSVYIVLVLGIIMSAANLLKALYGSTSAFIPGVFM